MAFVVRDKVSHWVAVKNENWFLGLSDFDKSQWQSTICQAQGGPGSTPARVKTSIHRKKMVTTHEKFILAKPLAFTLHS